MIVQVNVVFYLIACIFFKLLPIITVQSDLMRFDSYICPIVCQSDFFYFLWTYLVVKSPMINIWSACSSSISYSPSITFSSNQEKVVICLFASASISVTRGFSFGPFILTIIGIPNIVA